MSIFKIHHRARKGFTLVELLVVIIVILALVAITVPLGRGMMTRSHAVNCSKNLRQIGIATMLYAADNNMTLPVTTHQRRQGGKSWKITLQPYLGGDTKSPVPLNFRCPADPVESREFTYLLNDFLTPNPAGAPDLNFSYLSRLTDPARTLMFAEASPEYTNADHFHFAQYYGNPIPPEVFENQVNVTAHGDKSNYLFADGHVETLTRHDVRKLLGGGFIDPSGSSSGGDELIRIGEKITDGELIKIEEEIKEP